MNSLQKWKKYWKNQSIPVHRYDNEFWHKCYAEEINLLLRVSGYSEGAVLETGCGNGVLFGHLNLNKKDYVGVDFSMRLLTIFRINYPKVRLICAEASSFLLNKKFSLIFSNGMIQYFDKAMVHEYIFNSLNMLANEGILLIANIPWRHNRFKYFTGELRECISLDMGKLVKSMLASIIKGNDGIGNWYNPRDFLKYGNNKIRIFVYGSLFYPYRFSVVFKKER